MGDHKAWNGTAWVRPRFWDGSGWLEYIDPEWDIPRWQYPYTDGPEGWVLAGRPDEPAGWSGGQLVVPAIGGGLYGYGSAVEYIQDLNDVGYTVMEPPNLWSIKTRFRVISTAPFQQGEDVPIIAEWPYNFPDNVTPEIDYRYVPQVGATDTGWVDVTTPPANGPTAAAGAYLARGKIGTQGWDAQHTLYVESFDIVAQDGRPAMALGNALWEPYARTTDGRWI